MNMPTLLHIEHLMQLLFCISNCYMLISSELQISITVPSFVALHFSISEIVKCIT